ncbi:ribonucleoside triphosphate reductase [Candidatus Vampirococcus lugosii]|uniref:Ribonucleoside triphosphate reductase n=1 Tax=Candidatus Vampirococcus lugosii TaxID=2789015 RepID=A0ABS5QL99_9BACT|nr:ribonucleoside triphosphate reductase [Candidatus Vampirococcus lugosii]MBS8121923.1 ribonucleoside triphosphate reductase [Candidatus Vampirococcus lugosii]
MEIYKIQKRNGEIVDFDKIKINQAIIKAIKSVGGTDFSKVDFYTQEVINLILENNLDGIVGVEQIQDCVEEILIKNGHNETAKSYILYRNQRNESRIDKNVVVQVEKTMKEYLDRSDWRVNANANSGYSLGGLILNISGKVVANYWLSHIYPKYIGNLHRNGDIHIHDLDMFGGYCAGWSLRQLLEEGFNGLSDRVQSEPPKNLQSTVNQMINFLGTLQNERAGAQAFSSFDTYLAPFVHKYKEELKENLIELGVKFETKEKEKNYLYNMTYKYVYQQFQNFIFGLNVPSRWGTQTPFTNITLDWKCPDDLKDKALYLGGIQNGEYKKKYGELEEEMRLINRALIEVYTKGDANGNVFTFPIPTYNLTEDFPRNDPLVEDLFEMTAKYGIPYFQNFIGSQYKIIKDENGKNKKVKNEDAYSPGAVRSMCCRLQLDLKQLEKRGNGLFGSAEMTGSIGVITINMARIGYNYKGDIDGFKNRIKFLMDGAKSSLEIKRKELSKWLDKGLYPYTKRYLHSFRNHFSTIGINGINEAILNFTDGKEDITSNFGIKFAVEIMDFMRDILKEYQEETGNLYNLEATPAEGTTYRFAKEDKKQISDIIQAGTQDAPYYTNSSQIPVAYTDDPFEALDLQNELQCKYTGGTVLHMYMGERISSAQACKSFVKTIVSNYQLPYITISPTFSICPIHGYIAGEHEYCPKCDEEKGYKNV